MKNKIKLTALLFFVFTGIAKANTYWEQYVLNETCLTHDTATIININQKNVSSVSMQVVYSSASSPSTVSFGDGRVSTGSITISSNSALTNSNFSIGGFLLREGRDYTKGATAALTAKSISNGIMANSGLNAIIRSTWTALGVVTTTSTSVGSGTTYAMTTSSQAALTLSGSNMTGGIDSAYTINTALVNVVAHGLSTGLGVVYSTSTGITITPLIKGSTYYAIKINANVFELALTSTGAVAGIPILLTSSSTLGVHTFTLTSQVYSGTPSFIWRSSNDSVNWFDLPNTSSTTYSLPGNNMINGSIDFKYLGFFYTSGTTGCFNINVKGNGR